MLFWLHATNETVDFILENAAKDRSDDGAFTMRQTDKRAVVCDGRQQSQQLRVQPIQQVAHELMRILLLITTASCFNKYAALMSETTARVSYDM